MESTSKMLKSLENLFVSNNKFSGGVHTSKPKKAKQLNIFKSKMHKPAKVRAYVYERRIQGVPSRITKDDDFVSAFLNMTVMPKKTVKPVKPVKAVKQTKAKKTVASRPTKMKTEGLMDDIDFIIKSFNKVKVSSKVTKKPKREGTRKSVRSRNKPQRLNPSAPLKGKKKSSSKKSSSKKSSKNSSSSSNSMMMFF